MPYHVKGDKQIVMRVSDGLFLAEVRKVAA
jgi:hypothetical protein